ncbi:hypothetical protein VTK56DRAFT_4670 [Thermocarpiscus australiensis]
MAALGKIIDRSCTGRNWLKSPQKRTMGMPPKSSVQPRSLQSCSFTTCSVRAPSMLTSSMGSRYFSCQSIRAWPSTYRFPAVEALLPPTVLLDPPRRPSFEKPQAEWIVTPLIRAAAVPDIAVTNRRCEMPLLRTARSRPQRDPTFRFLPDRP